MPFVSGYFRDYQRLVAAMFVAAFLVCNCLLLSPAQAATDILVPGIGHSLTVQEAERLALDLNPATRAARARERLASALLSEERARLLPTVQFLENYGYSNNPAFVFTSLLLQRRFTQQDFNIHRLNHPSPINNFQSTVMINLPIFNQLQTKTGIAQRRIGVTRATREEESVRQKLRVDVVRAFYGVLVAQGNLHVAENAVSMGQAEVKRLTNMHELGSVVYSDLLAMQVQLSEFEQRRLQAQGDLSIAYAQLNNVLGYCLVGAPPVVGGLTDREFMVPAEPEGLRQALESRPDYQAVRLLARERKEGIRAANGMYLPKVDFWASMIHAGNAVVNGGTNLGLGVNLTLDVFDWRKPARVRQSRASEDIALAEGEQKANEIKLEVTKAYQNFFVSKAKRDVAGITVKQAEEALRIVRDRYSVGLSQITELLRAENAAIQAQTNLLAARYDYYVSYAQVLSVTGNLSDLSMFSS